MIARMLKILANMAYRSIKPKKHFFDENRVILLDVRHSLKEKRYFCIGKTARGGIATVRFTIRNGHIRIIGAGYWRKGKKIYEQYN